MGAATGRVSAIDRVGIVDRIPVTTGRVTSISRGGGMLDFAGNGLVAYYRTDPQTISLVSTNRVASWADQSGNGKHSIQTIPNRRPTLTNNWFGNLPGITFATSQVLIVASQIQTSIAGWTMGGVFQSTSNTGPRTIFAPSGSGGGHYLGVRVSGNPNREVITNQVGAAQDGAISTGVEVWIAKGAANANPVLVNLSMSTGVTNTTQTLTPSILSCFTPSGGQSFIGGISITGTQAFIGGTVGELFFMNRFMSSEEVARYLSYVQTRYGTI